LICISTKRGVGDVADQRFDVAHDGGQVVMGEVRVGTCGLGVIPSQGRVSIQLLADPCGVAGGPELGRAGSRGLFHNFQAVDVGGDAV